jgi:NADH:ubiquinone oxidoreductase subunit E
MLLSEREHMRERVEALAERYGGRRTALIPILQEVQRRYSRIDPYVMQVIADLLGIHPVEVYSVISFFSFLSGEPEGRFAIRLCRSISCDLAGRACIARQLETDLGIKFGQTTPDGRFTLAWANCIGMCDRGPALLVNERVYTHVTPATVHEIIEECRSTFGLHAVQRAEERLS